MQGLVRARRLLAVQVSPESRQSVLRDVLTVYGGSGKSIIFTQTKREADSVCAAISNTHPCEVREDSLQQIFSHVGKRHGP